MAEQGFPQISAPIADSNGRITYAWMYLLQNLWSRTGQALGRTVAIRYYDAGKPGAGQINCQVLGEALRFGSGFSGAQAVALVAATAETQVMINRVRAGVVTLLGSVTFAAAGTSGTFASEAASTDLAVGDILQLEFPDPADATLADICVTFQGALIT